MDKIHYDMDGWVVPESKACSCGGTEDTGHTQRCRDYVASIMTGGA